MPCSGIISNSDIESIYKLSNNYVVSFPRNECRFSNSSKFVFITVTKDSLPILDKPIVWDYLASSRLYKNLPHSGNGKVAKYDQIQINSAFRDEKLAKQFEERLVPVYKRNLFKEIQITAINDGIIVWPKLFYSFVNSDDEKKIIRQFEQYLVCIHNLIDDTDRNMKMSKIKTIIDIPKSLSNPKDGKMTFPDYLTEKIKTSKISILLKLYKEVA